jgi:hypothetical protein
MPLTKILPVYSDCPLMRVQTGTSPHIAYYLPFITLITLSLKAG